jgi:hypothetical protein
MRAKSRVHGWQIKDLSISQQWSQDHVIIATRGLLLDNAAGIHARLPHPPLPQGTSPAVGRGGTLLQKGQSQATGWLFINRCGQLKSSTAVTEALVCQSSG